LVQLSVHSLPSAQGQSQAQAQSRLTWRGRLKMLLVLAVCAAPVIASYVSYYLIRPMGRANYGTLITPPVPMPTPEKLPLQLLQGAAMDAAGHSPDAPQPDWRPQALQGQWLLVVVSSGDCDAACEQRLYWQRQLREMLGREKERLDRVWLVTGAQPVRAALKPAMAGGWIVQGSASAVSEWLAPEPGQALEGHIYLVDPRGEWMMRFPVQPDVGKVKKDLSRLLKANESWDEAGRP